MPKTTVAVEKLSGTISPIKCLINSHKTKRYFNILTISTQLLTKKYYF